MSLMFVQTHDLSWQDRTINVELMMAPGRGQLLYNKHKSLNTKCEQEHFNLEREKESFLKSYKTDQRMMERRKESYVKKKDLIARRSHTSSRRSSLSTPGCVSAPPNLESDLTTLHSRLAFITELKARESKSADPRTTFLEKPSHPRYLQLEALDINSRQPSACSRSATPGKPFLTRNKSVRFLPSGNTCPHSKKDAEEDEEEEHRILPVDERIKKFLVAQNEFNNRDATTMVVRPIRPLFNPPKITRKIKAFSVNLNKLEDAFDDFCNDGSSDGLQKLVRYAAKLKASVRLARNSQIMPRRPSIFAPA